MQVLLVALVLVLSPAVTGFSHARATSRSKQTLMQETKDSSAWPGDRIPATNPLFFDQKMDAAWGRGKYRTEIWNDNVNPMNDWWTAYAPSEEEIAASQAGFDFSDAEGWCKEKGLDYEKSYAAAKDITLKQLQEVLALVSHNRLTNTSHIDA